MLFVLVHAQALLTFASEFLDACGAAAGVHGPRGIEEFSVTARRQIPTLLHYVPPPLSENVGGRFHSGFIAVSDAVS